MKLLNVKLKETVNNNYLKKELESIIKIYPNCQLFLGKNKLVEGNFLIEVLEGTLYRRTSVGGGIKHLGQISYVNSSNGELVTYNGEYTKSFLVFDKKTIYNSSDTFPSSATLFPELDGEWGTGVRGTTFLTCDDYAIIKIKNVDKICYFLREAINETSIVLLENDITLPLNYITESTTYTKNITIGGVSRECHIEQNSPIKLFVNGGKYPTYPTIEIMDDKILDNYFSSAYMAPLFYEVIKNDLIDNNVVDGNKYLTLDTSIPKNDTRYILKSLQDNSILGYFIKFNNYYAKCDDNNATSQNPSYVKQVYYNTLYNTLTEILDIANALYAKETGNSKNVLVTGGYRLDGLTDTGCSYTLYVNFISANNLYIIYIDTKHKPIGSYKYLRTFGSSTNPIGVYNFDFEDKNNGLDSEHLPKITSIQFVPLDKLIDIRCYGRITKNWVFFGFLLNSNVKGRVEDLMDEFIKNGRTEGFTIVSNSVITYNNVPIGYAKTMRFLYNAETGTFEKEE